MIPQAMMNSGDYAELWGHLKSMEHALERVQTAPSLKEIAELDKARLLALTDFLKKELQARDVDAVFSPDAFFTQSSAGHGYSLDVDLPAMLHEVPSFRDWLRSQKLSFADKTERLVKALEEYSKQISECLFPENLPKAEFEILHDLISRLLQQTESALVA